MEILRRNPEYGQKPIDRINRENLVYLLGGSGLFPGIQAAITSWGILRKYLTGTNGTN